MVMDFIGVWFCWGGECVVISIVDVVIVVLFVVGCVDLNDGNVIVWMDDVVL